jgi:uncharacterized protein YcfJ
LPGILLLIGRRASAFLALPLQIFPRGDQMRIKVVFAGLIVLVGVILAGWWGREPVVRAQNTSQAVYTTQSPSSSLITPVVVRRYYYRRRPRRRVVVVRRRPFSHSAAIVGGSAAAGAGVGALVGGGHGAIAGALVGGAGGLIYDRATHKKKRVVTR